MEKRRPHPLNDYVFLNTFLSVLSSQHLLRIYKICSCTSRSALAHSFFFFLSHQTKPMGCLLITFKIKLKQNNYRQKYDFQMQEYKYFDIYNVQPSM